ncbi:putative transmembrane anti-sigma factor [Mycobacterium avium subsp. avium 2285 (R)]|nr:putative transmembrane anti-sigma factor [Mycobacterium avium subsp. avium 2285 (R)]
MVVDSGPAGDRVGRADGPGRHHPADLDRAGQRPALGHLDQPEVRVPGPLNAHHDTLAMVVVGRDGSRTRLATWVAVPGHTASPAGSISTPVDQIAAVQVVAADSGQVLLQRSL